VAAGVALGVDTGVESVLSAVVLVVDVFGFTSLLAGAALGCKISSNIV